MKQEQSGSKKTPSTSEIKSMFASFIAEYYMPTKKITRLTSYKYKHIFEKMTGHYICNEEAKAVFNILGYRRSKAELNEQYNIKLRPQFRYNEQNRYYIIDKIKQKQKILSKYSVERDFKWDN